MSERPETPGEPRRRRWLRAILGITLRTTIVLGWCAFVATLGVVILEQSGWVTWKVERELRRRLGNEVGPFRLGSTEIAWTERSVRVHGIGLGEDDRDLFIDELELRLGWDGSLVLEHAVVRGGHMRVSDSLTAALREIGEEFAGDSTEEPDPSAPFPTLAVHGFDVTLETPAYGDVAIGRVDVCLRSEVQATGPQFPRLAGRLRTAVAGADGSPNYVYLNGRLEDRTLVVHSTARNLPLDLGYLPEGLRLALLQSLDPTGLVHLEAQGTYVIGESVLPEASVRLAIKGGSLRLEHLERADERRVEDVEALVRVDFQPGPRARLWERETWSGAARVGAGWSGFGANGWLRFGREARGDHLAEAWFELPDLSLSTDMLELASGSAAVVKITDEIEGAYAPEGSATLNIAVRLPANWEGERPWQTIERAYEVTADGNLSVAYVGYQKQGVRNQGFPLRVHETKGSLLYTFQPDLPLPESMGILGVTGNHGSGEMSASGSILVKPHWVLPEETPGLERIEFHLAVSSDALAVDETLEQAFVGLAGILPPEELWLAYQPSGGNLGFQYRMWGSGRGRRRINGRLQQVMRLSTQVDIELDEVGATWREFPLPLHSIDGNVNVSIVGIPRDDGGGARSTVSVLATGENEAVPSGATLRGHVQSDPEDRIDKKEQPTQHFALEARGIDVTDPELFEVCTRMLPDVAAALGLADVRGELDANIVQTRALPGGDSLTQLEFHPGERGLELKPAFFPVPTDQLLGRLFATVLQRPSQDVVAPSEPEWTLAFSPLVGRWGTPESESPVTLVARLGSATESSMRILAAGIDTTDETFYHALEVAGGGQESDDDALDSRMLDGFLDLSAELASEGDDSLRIDLFPRHVNLDTDGPFRLEDVVGRLHYIVAESRLEGQELHARLGDTEVTLTDFRLDEVNGRNRLRTKLASHEVPLDREHLQYFSDEDSLRTLLDELQWRGRVDIEDGDLELTWTNADDAVLDFGGQLTLSDMYVWLGVPVSLRSASADVTLTLESERTRAWAKVRDVYGEAAGRSLECESMILTYVEPRLTIEHMRGTLEGGELTSIGADPSFLTVDLAEPYPFRIAAAIREVSMGGLLKGLFNSDFANKGRLSGSVRLAGDTDHLLESTGGGTLKLHNSSLWSIPVFQALFAQLGFDTTATFDAMKCQYELVGGEILMREMELDSDLLKLVGKGKVNFDGTLAHDLEVQYSLLDRLGPFRWLLYKIQNGLLRVSIRGDMARPRVRLKGLLSGLLPAQARNRQLPLPGYSELPTRF